MAAIDANRLYVSKAGFGVGDSGVGSLGTEYTVPRLPILNLTK